MGSEPDMKERAIDTKERAIDKKETAADQMKKVKDLLLTAQERFQKVSSELHEIETDEDLKNFKQDLRESDKYSQKPVVYNTYKPKKNEENKIIRSAEDSKENSDYSDSYSDSDYVSDSEEDDKKTKKPSKMLRISSEKQSPDKSRDSSKKGSNYDSALDLADYNLHLISPELNNIKINISNFLKQTHDFNKEAEGPQITTTVRTASIYNKTFRVRDDIDITNFFVNLYNETIHVFNTVKRRTDQEPVKKLIDNLERSYKVKFKEFLIDTSGKKIKTRLGTQKVILNSIETSTGFLNRLANFLAEDISHPSLRDNFETVNTFKKVVEKAEKLELEEACKKFGICRSNSLFSVFVTKLLDTMLLYDGTKFTQTRDALTEELKYLNFSALHEKAQKKLKHKVDSLERMDQNKAKVVVAILKNTIVNRNKPIIVNPLRSNLVNSTLALFEIIDLLDAKFVGNETKWVEIENSFKDFGDDRRDDIQIIMADLVEHIKNNLKSLDHESQKILLKHIITVLNLS